jgi:hypothetical protein
MRKCDRLTHPNKRASAKNNNCQEDYTLSSLLMRDATCC